MKTKILFTLVLAFLIFLGATAQIDTQAVSIHDDTTERAFFTFAIAKAINAVISLIQGTELSFAPVGVGLTFSVGELLDPLNDMVERFSWIMLLSSASLVIQKFIIAFSSLFWIKAALIGVSVFAMLSLWVKKLQAPAFFSVTLRTLLVLLILRFGILGIVYIEALSFNTLMAPQYTEATLQLQQTEKKLKAIELNEQPQASRKSDSILDYAEEKYDQAVRAINIRSQLEALSHNIDEAQNQMVNLVAMFVLHTILLPLLFSWLFIVLIRWTFNKKFDIRSLSNRKKSNISQPPILL